MSDSPAPRGDRTATRDAPLTADELFGPVDDAPAPKVGASGRVRRSVQPGSGRSSSGGSGRSRSGGGGSGRGGSGRGRSGASSGRSGRVSGGTARSRGRAHPVRWTLLALLFLVLFAVVWVGVRGVLAAKDLAGAQPLTTALRSQLAAGDADRASETAAELRDRASSARSNTGDPIWRLAEYTPWVGPNLRAVRQVAAVLDSVSQDAVEPLTRVAGSLSADAVTPRSGKFDLAPLAAAQPSMATAARTLDRAAQDVAAIDTDSTIAPVAVAVGQLRTAVTAADRQVDTANRVVQLAPTMLAQDGTRSYLLLFQNNAELRAGGGIPGAVALLGADHGAVHLSSQTAATAIGPFDEPVMPLATETEGLYGGITARYMQNVTLTPRFDTSGALARAMWQRQTGQQVDGVVAIDPVSLSYVLRATGPVRLPTGETLTAENAVRLLLSDTYATHATQQAQDDFFASAATAVFERVTAGGFDAKAFIAALTTGTDEGRVRLWSADRAEQRHIAGSAVAGELPAAVDGAERFGVYLNDATGAKMDYYLQKTVSVGAAVCRPDGRPTWVVEVTLENTAPADAGTSLPGYVTGANAFGVTPGDIGTRVLVYAPTDGIYVRSTQDGKPASPQTAQDGGHPVAQFATRLAPGQTTTIRTEYVGPLSDAGSPIGVDSTPGVHQTATRTVRAPCEASVS